MKKLSVMKLPAIAFAAVGAIYLLYFAIYGFYPFGERSIAWCDLEQQYLPLLMELREIILDGGSFLLGKGGGGMNLWGVVLFFVSSPLGMLSLLVSSESMIYFINILTVLKLALCGASASYFFGRLFRSLPSCFNVLLSAIYPLSGYVMMYYQNNMWLDVMIIFPPLLLSLFSLCEQGKWKSYTILMSLAMFMNFYLCYMIVLFVVISFGVMIFFCCEKEKRGSVAVKFLLSDLCAALITAVVWIPSMKQFTSSGRGDSFTKQFTVGGFFFNGDDKLALLISSSMAVAAILAMLARNRMFRKGRAAYIMIMMLIMLAGAFIEPANKIWHTGNYQAYPLRYGFIIILLALSAAAVLLSEAPAAGLPEKKRSFPMKSAMAAVLGGAVIVFAIGIANHGEYTSYTSTLWLDGGDSAAVIICGAVGAAALLIFFAGYSRSILGRRLTAAFMSVIVLCGSLFSFGIFFDNINDVTLRFSQTTELSGKIDDDGFYRAKSSKRYFYSNMMEAMGYSSIGHYTSLTDKDFLFTAKQLGYSAYWMDISSNGGNLLTDAFLMNKYVFGLSGDKNGFYENYNTDDVLKIYRSTIASEGALISGISPGELSDFENTQRMESTEYIAEKLYGAEDILRRAEPYAAKNLEYSEGNGTYRFEITDPQEKASLKYSLYVSGRQELYADVFGNYSTALKEPYFESVSIYVNGSLISDYYPNKKENGILDLGTYEDQFISVEVVVHKDFEAAEFGIYLLDGERLEECVSSASTGAIELDGNKIRITAESSGSEYVYIPFAYSGGYSAKVNGSDASIEKALGAFMAVKLEEGVNEIVLTFYPEGFSVGAVISLCGIILFAFIALFGGRFRIRRRIEKAALAAVLVLSAGAFAVIYILSSVLWIVLQIMG
ncbi:MAG: YfhO family protein [Ruminococcus sp.]|nr:YfhO family protein [Ruminococcus sp.]